MKKAVIVLLSFFALAIVLGSNADIAEEIEETPSPTPIIIDIVPIVTPTPTPIAPVKTEEPTIEIRHYSHNEEDVELLARLLWSSPLRHEKYKRALCWIVFNRIDDNSGLFGDSISEVVTTTEFSFFDSHAHRSKENLRIAQECLDEYKSEKDGCYVGWHIPKKALYISFYGDGNRYMNVLSKIGGEPLQIMENDR